MREFARLEIENSSMIKGMWNNVLNHHQE